jgi:hypothetical protein
MTYRITGLDPEPFQALFGLSDAELATRGVERHRVDASPGFPDRITLRDAEPGQTVLLLNHEHQPADTPFRARHAIFVLEGATEAAETIGVLPPALAIRPLSLRAFDASGRMIDADLAEGSAIEPTIERLLSDRRVDYLHAHYAKRGCYAARVDRVQASEDGRGS